MDTKRSAFSVYQELQDKEELEHSHSDKETHETIVENEKSDNIDPTLSKTKLKCRKRKLAQKAAIRKRRKIVANEKEIASTHHSIDVKKDYGKAKELKIKNKTKVVISSHDEINSESDELCMPNLHGDEDAGVKDAADHDIMSHPCSTDGVPQRTRNLESINLDLPFIEQFNSDNYKDSRVAARELFKLLISPVETDRFFKEVWEQKPMLLRRHKPHYNDGLISTEILDTILRENHLEFTTNVDVTSYEDGKRHTHNPMGRAFPSVVWEFFQNGCSVRVLNPQSYSQPLWLVNSTLQEHFQSCVGANLYLTPAGSQGFAPHYDDIDAFILQLEGRKHWKVYNPKSLDEVLPRYSSPNFAQDELGQMALEVTLEPGDLLYFPRGFTHQASTPPDYHSLHVTISANQKNSWGDLLEKLIPDTLQRAIAENVDFRECLPPEYLDYIGVVNSNSTDARRGDFFAKISDLITQLANYAPVDAAADQMGASYIHDCLPPCLSSSEKMLSVNGGGMKWKGCKALNGVTLTLDSKVRLLRHGVVRLVTEEDKTVLYFSTQNSRVYHGREPMGIDISANDAPVIEHLMKSYPEFVSIDTLPSEEGTQEDKVSLCYVLYDQGLLLLKS